MRNCVFTVLGSRIIIMPGLLMVICLYGDRCLLSLACHGCLCLPGSSSVTCRCCCYRCCPIIPAIPTPPPVAWQSQSLARNSVCLSQNGRCPRKQPAHWRHGRQHITPCHPNPPSPTSTTTTSSTKSPSEQSVPAGGSANGRVSRGSGCPKRGGARQAGGSRLRPAVPCFWTGHWS